MQLSLGDFVAARRSLKKAFSLGSQQDVDREAVKKAFKQGERERGLFVSLKTTEMERVELGHTCQPGLGFLCLGENVIFIDSMFFLTLAATLNSLCVCGCRSDSGQSAGGSSGGAG